MQSKKDAKISVLMSVYKNDKPDWVITAVESIINQTLTPDEVVLFVDGPIGNDLNQAVEKLVEKYKIINLQVNAKNMGLGLTLKTGIEKCKNEIIARMDSDDYSVPTRLEEQYKVLQENNLDLVGSNVNEFIDDVNNIVSTKTVPSNKDEIIKYSKSRNPFCHPSVMYRKSKVLEAGNYLDMHLCEDYYLWVRMLQKGCNVANIDKPLVHMRVSKDLYARRGGLKYYKSQKKLLKYMRETKYISFFAYTKNKIIRFCVQVLMPNWLRQKFYVKGLRKS